MLNTTIRMDADANGKDPDTYSYHLATSHQQLWSKPLPNGEFFQLHLKGRSKFSLVYQGKQERFVFTSDSIGHTMSKWKKMKPIIDQVETHEIESFYDIALTIGGYVIFPANRIENKPTINAMRGLLSTIRDRFDLTLECIRLYYENQSSPLYEHLKQYQSFFDLFLDFKGYVDFFLLQDLVDENYKIQFWLPFESFGNYIVIPGNMEEYQTYKANVIKFILQRNCRMEES
jgi:hypothetical protein